MKARSGQRAVGAGAIALAVAFNVPYAGLAATFQYPAVLRRPADEVLALFLAAGPELIVLWYGFMLCALAMTAIAPLLAISPPRLAVSPALAVGAAISGSLAGLAQAVGLSRWVFAVPELARAQGEASAAAQSGFQLLNAWGGVAIGEHIGQSLTALFVLQMALMQRTEPGYAFAARAGFLTALMLAVGTGEGLMMALGGSGAVFAAVTSAGFVGLTLWLLATGVGLVHNSKRGN